MVSVEKTTSQCDKFLLCSAGFPVGGGDGDKNTAESLCSLPKTRQFVSSFAYYLLALPIFSPTTAILSGVISIL